MISIFYLIVTLVILSYTRMVFWSLESHTNWVFAFQKIVIRLVKTIERLQINRRTLETRLENLTHKYDFNLTLSKLYQSATSTMNITLDPCEITTGVGIKMIDLGWMAYTE